MRFVRPVIAALAIGCSAASLTIMSATMAAAQTQPNAAPTAAVPAAAPKQMALTDKQVSGVIAAQKDMDAAMDKLPQTPSEKPDPKVLAQLEAVAKQHGFASFEEYNQVLDNISIVLGGIDPKTKKYVGPEAVIKSQIASVQADKTMPAKDKKLALDELNAALKTPGPKVEFPANTAVVEKYYDKLNEVLSDSE